MFDRCSIIDTAYLPLPGSFPTQSPAFLVAIATVNINDYSDMPRGFKHILKLKVPSGGKKRVYPSLGRWKILYDLNSLVTASIRAKYTNLLL